jgi:CheY-like chemotaxis protein
VRILLVEDGKPLRRENEGALQRAGYEVICAEDGEAALEMAQEGHPDLILLDMNLPKMTGPEVLRHLKSEAKTKDIPVVVLSSLSEKNRQKLLEEGAEDYLENAHARLKSSAERAGECDLPHQPQARNCVFECPRAALETTGRGADVLPLTGERPPAAASPIEMPRTSCSPTGRRGHTLPENSARARRGCRHTSAPRRAVP